MGFCTKDKARLIKCSKRDANLLMKQGLMDYSLLLAVTDEGDDIRQKAEKMEEQEDAKKSGEISLHAIKHEEIEKSKHEKHVSRLRKIYEGNRHIYVTENGYILYMGIIDYLQTFDFAKRMESTIKRFRHGKKKMEEVSAIEPEPYCERFKRFITTNILRINDK